MLHNLLFKHRISTRPKWGEFIYCLNRFTGQINQATWFPSWLKGQYADITYIDIDELTMFTDPVAAFNWVGYQNAKH